jgi:signal transduction histidine kinase
VTLVRDEAGRAMRLLDDLADLARLEVRVADDEPARPLAVDEVVLEMRERLAPLAESAGVELVAEAEPAVVRIARKRLEQLVVNLVRNALRAVEDGAGTRIVVFARAHGDSVAIGCEDDGPGIASDELPRIFDRFFRGSSGRSGATGSGLGLTIVRRIAEAAHGSVDAEPVDPRGVRIVARLPADQAVTGRPHAPVQT